MYVNICILILFLFPVIKTKSCLWEDVLEIDVLLGIFPRLINLVVIRILWPHKVFDRGVITT